MSLDNAYKAKVTGELRKTELALTRIADDMRWIKILSGALVGYMIPFSIWLVMTVLENKSENHELALKYQYLKEKVEGGD